MGIDEFFIKTLFSMGINDLSMNSVLIGMGLLAKGWDLLKKWKKKETDPKEYVLLFWI